MMFNQESIFSGNLWIVRLLVLLVGSLCLFFQPTYRLAKTQTTLSETMDIPDAPYQGAKLLGTITNPLLTEISGLAPSHTNKELFWVHNDSGDEARLYVINRQGQLLGQFSVANARNQDWEDMASYQSKDGKPMLLIADSGNNSANRAELTLYRLPEPNLLRQKKGQQKGTITAIETFKYRYPDASQDAEALFVDPATGRPYLVSKLRKPGCAIYRFPLPLRSDQTVTLEKVNGNAADAVRQLIMVTGAATSPDGLRLVIRTYFTALEFTRTAKQPFEALFAAKPRRVRIPLERQGEAISYTSDSRALVTTSERIPAPLFLLQRQ